MCPSYKFLPWDDLHDQCIMRRPYSEESPCLLDANWTSEKWESMLREIESCREAARQGWEEKKERKKDSQMT